jgi:acetoin utilization protein AcuB
MKVKQVMSRNVTTVKADRPLSELAELFAQPNIGGMPVVDEANNMIGIVTMADFIGHFLPHSPLLIQELISSKDESVEKDILSVGWEDTKIEDIMEKRVVTIREEDSIVKAAALFYEHKIRILPVLNSLEKLVGIVTLSDVCKGIYESISKR